jgi:membrane protease YdiL (CAAX protease family)
LDLIPYVGFIAEWMGVIAVAWLLALSKRLRKPVVGFQYARRDGLIALGLYATILLFSILYVAAQPPVFPQPLRIGPAPVTDFGYWLVLAGACLLPFLAAMIIRKQPARSIGWDPDLLRPGLMVGVAMAFLTIFLRNRMMDVLGGINKEGVVALGLALGIALAEETIFRGYIQMRLAWWLGQWPGMILSALLFTLWHVPAWVRALPLETILLLAGLTFVQGLVLGWIMLRARHIAAPALYRAISLWVSWIG